MSSRLGSEIESPVKLEQAGASDLPVARSQSGGLDLREVVADHVGHEEPAVTDDVRVLEVEPDQLCRSATAEDDGVLGDHPLARNVQFLISGIRASW